MLNGLYKAELIHARPAWPSVTEVESATMNSVHWWNDQRLHEALGYATSAEVEPRWCWRLVAGLIGWIRRSGQEASCSRRCWNRALALLDSPTRPDRTGPALLVSG